MAAPTKPPTLEWLVRRRTWLRWMSKPGPKVCVNGELHALGPSPEVLTQLDEVNALLAHYSAADIDECERALADLINPDGGAP